MIAQNDMWLAFEEKSGPRSVGAGRHQLKIWSLTVR
jgi:hypothetical protein